MGLSVVFRLLLSLLAISLHKGHGTAKLTGATTTGRDLHLLQQLRLEGDGGHVLPLKEIESKQKRKRSTEEEDEEVEDTICSPVLPGGATSSQYLIQALEAMRSERDQARTKVREMEEELNQLKEETSSRQSVRHHVPKCICPSYSTEELTLINQFLDEVKTSLTPLMAPESVGQEERSLTPLMAPESVGQEERSLTPLMAPESVGQEERVRRDCYEYYAYGKNSSGIYTINPLETSNSSDHIQVWCDMAEKQLPREAEPDAGGWTVILLRKPLTGQDQVSFNRTWDDYKRGFGNPNTEYWIGNDILNRMTSGEEPQSLWVSMMDWSGIQKFARYDVIDIAGESDNYRLRVKGFYRHSTAGNSLKKHHNMMFSTPDRDNDEDAGNCAFRFGSGFWYSDCFDLGTSPTHPLLGEENSNFGVIWYHFNTGYTNLKKMTMMIRPMLDEI